MAKRKRQGSSRKPESSRSFGRAQLLQEGHLPSNQRLPRWFAAALDIIARQRATQEPMENVLQKVNRSYHLGSKERKQVGDAVFSWARSTRSIENAWNAGHRHHGGRLPDRRTRDHLGLILAGLWAGKDLDAFPPAPAALAHFLDTPRPQEILSLPDWLLRRFKKVYGSEAKDLVSALHKPAPLVLATHPIHVSPEALKRECAKLECHIDASPIVPHAFRCDKRFSLRQLPKDLQEHVWPMDDGSQLVAHTLSPKKDEKILDLCAGGGGKSRILSNLGASVYAMDASMARLQSLSGLDLKCSVLADGRRPPFRPGCFDKVLVDAPCTGTGTFRRAPDLGSRIEEKEQKSYQSLQIALLLAAGKMVRAGGLIVYATCSLLPEENEVVIEEALKEAPDIVPVPLSSAWDFCPHPEPINDECHFTLLPSREGCDGFFVATLRKN